MRRNRVVRVLKLLPFGVVAVAVFGFVIMSLWNWLMPTLFGLKEIGFWQALGVFILSKILFGGLGGGAQSRGYSRRRFMERWARMTPEEREKLREELLRARCSPFEPPQSKPTP
jgi:hypothetical protein